MTLVKHPRFENPLPGQERTIAADPAKQHRSDAVSGTSLASYTDQLLTCRQCGRVFYFFAEEQRYWYEVLGFWLDARCVHCPVCRRKRQRLRALQRSYRYLRQLEVPSLAEIKRFRIVTKTLIRLGCMRDRRKIDRFG